LNPKALVKRTFKYKKAAMEFICPLCGTYRAFTLRPQIAIRNYLHIFMITVILVMCLYPVMKLNAVWLFFVVWGVYECILRMLFRKQVACPHCGFDVSWYRKDVKVARKQVEEFWKNKTPAVKPKIVEEVKSAEISTL